MVCSILVQGTNTNGLNSSIKKIVNQKLDCKITRLHLVTTLSEHVTLSHVFHDESFAFYKDYIRII